MYVFNFLLVLFLCDLTLYISECSKVLKVKKHLSETTFVSPSVLPLDLKGPIYLYIVSWWHFSVFASRVESGLIGRKFRSTD